MKKGYHVRAKGGWIRELNLKYDHLLDNPDKRDGANSIILLAIDALDRLDRLAKKKVR